MHVLVTGGTGFFGRALLRHWRANVPDDFRVTILSRNPSRFVGKYGALLAGLPVTVITGDVRDAESMPRTGNFSHLIHAAAESTLGSGLRPIERLDEGVVGTRNVFDAAVRLGIKRVLFTSSGGVYGAPAAAMDRIPEDFNGIPDPLALSSSYALGKRVGEHLCAVYAAEYGLEPVVARCFAFSGIDLPLDAHFAIGNFVRDAVRGEQIVIKGDGTPLRSYLDQRDLASWLMTLLTAGKSMRAYNVGSDEVVSVAELAQMVASLAPTPTGVAILGASPAEDVVRHRYVPDITRVRAELGLKITVSLADSIKSMISVACAHD